VSRECSVPVAVVVAALGSILLLLAGTSARADEGCRPEADDTDLAPCTTRIESIPVVRTPPILVAPEVEPVNQARRIVKKGVAPEVLEFLRRMHGKIVDSQEYPLNAVKLGLQGTTTVKIHLLPDGQAESVRVRKSSGHHVLDKAALDAVHRVLPLAPPPEAGNRLLEVDVPISFSLR